MKIQELFDTGKKLDRQIESVVTFADKKAEDLKNEINEYVVTDKLKESYHKVVDLMQTGFSDNANEVGIWVSGFYGSGKSSFAKYLGFSFDTSLIVDGMSFGEKLMNRISEPEVTAMHKSIIKRFNPMVVMIDLSTQAQVGKTSNVSDIIYYESLKALGLATSKDPKIISFNALLKENGKYDEFVDLVKEKKGKDWETVQKNDLLANLVAAEMAPLIMPEYFQTKEDFRSMKIETVESEDERIRRLINLFKIIKGHDKILFVLDEVGQYVSSNINMILNLQGFMQTIKSQFRGDVWLIATAQQTLSEDNPQAQLNSNELFRLNARFPVKVDIEAEDIKEIITKRLLGKSSFGNDRLKDLYQNNEGSIKMNTKLNMENARSRYIQIPEAQKFADLYPFLPVHIDILLALLQKLASRTGGVGLRSVIRLIRDILVDNHLADENVGVLANPSHFYDVLKSDMEKSPDYREVIRASEEAIKRPYSNSRLAVTICKTIAVMQILDDFPLTFDNICSLLYLEIGKDVKKSEIKEVIDEIKTAPGITLEEVEGKYRFMTNAILSVKEEKNRITVSDQKRDEILKELVKDLLMPAPQVQIYGNKTIKPSVELAIGRRNQSIHSGDNLKIIFNFVEPGDFEDLENKLRGESTEKVNEKTMFVISTLPQSISQLLFEIGQDEAIVIAHNNDNNKEIRDYLKSQEEDARTKKQEIKKLLSQALGNSESIWQGQTEGVNSTTYITKSLKKFAEKVFEKYKYAPSTVGINAVRDLSKYENWSSIPSALNPLGLIQSDGSIDSSADALRDLYDYISAKDPDGSRLLNDFDAAPYGWAKDTTRYLVALLLKDNKIVIRSGAQTFKMLTDKAAEAIKNNSSFNSVGLSRNNDRQLSPSECLKAKKALTELFNPGNLSLTIDSLAKAAFKAMTSGRFKSESESISHIYQQVGLAGLDIVNRAIGYADRIIQSEGSDAPQLFAQEQDCVDSMKYVLEVEKAKVLPTIQTIKKRFDEISELTPLPQLKTFFNEINKLKEVYNTLLRDEDCKSHKSEFADIESKLREEIKIACDDFCLLQNIEIENKISGVLAAYDLSKLTYEQKERIKNMGERIKLSQGGGQLKDLKYAITEYNLAFNPSGSIYQIGTTVADYIIANEPAPDEYQPPKHGETNLDKPEIPSEDSGSEDNQSKSKPIDLPKKLSKTGLKDLIEKLQLTISDMKEGDSVEFNISLS